MIFLPAKSFAADSARRQCNLNYKAAVASCKESWALADVTDKHMKQSAKKACMETAKRAKKQCKAGTNQCLTDCQANYQEELQICQDDFDAIDCGDDTACEAFWTEQKDICDEAALANLNACATNCPAD